MMRPIRAASLWTMIVSIDRGLTAISNVVLMSGQIERAIGADPSHDSIGINQSHFDGISRDLAELVIVANDLSLDATLHFIEYSQDLLSRGNILNDGSLIIGKNNAERLERSLEAIRINFLVQMQSKLVFVMDSAHAQFVTSEVPPFGTEVDDAFPRAGEEIAEAAKCLAFQRYTAAVFHLMRAMELAVQRLAEALGKQPPTNKAWGIILSEIHSEIEKMPKGSRRDAWSACHAHLYHVKQAWRNDTMHPKTTYTEEQAETVFDAVRSFMIHLARMT